MMHKISFCVDTGADKSLLLPDDGMLMGLDYSRLTGDNETVGLGGISHNFVESALITFAEAGRYLYIYETELDIAAPVPELMGVPSVLGRDILNRWRMNYNPTKGRLTFQVISADITLPIQ